MARSPAQTVQERERGRDGTSGVLTSVRNSGAGYRRRRRGEGGDRRRRPELDGAAMAAAARAREPRERRRVQGRPLYSRDHPRFTCGPAETSGGDGVRAIRMLRTTARPADAWGPLAGGRGAVAGGRGPRGSGSGAGCCCCLLGRGPKAGSERGGWGRPGCWAAGAGPAARAGRKRGREGEIKEKPFLFIKQDSNQFSKRFRNQNFRYKFEIMGSCFKLFLKPKTYFLWNTF